MTPAVAELRELAASPVPLAVHMARSLRFLPPNARDADVLAVMRRYLTLMSVRWPSELAELDGIEDRLLGVEDRIAGKESA